MKRGTREKPYTWYDFIQRGTKLNDASTEEQRAALDAAMHAAVRKANGNGGRQRLSKTGYFSFYPLAPESVMFKVIGRRPWRNKTTIISVGTMDLYSYDRPPTIKELWDRHEELANMGYKKNNPITPDKMEFLVGQSAEKLARTIAKERPLGFGKAYYVAPSEGDPSVWDEFSITRRGHKEFIGPWQVKE